jgi:DNA-binding response OmpR family regulator
MLAKISGIFKRRYPTTELVSGDLTVNKQNRTVYKKDKLIEMTAKEFDLLVLLMENSGKVLTKEFMFDRIWGGYSYSEQQTLTVHIRWLRQKIEDNPAKPQIIQTVWGVGYKYEGI